MVSEEELKNMSPEQIAELQSQNCIFCKIAKGEVPSKKIYDDSDFVGVLDINPGSKGHVLIIPKVHVQVMPQLSSELVGKLGVVCKNVSHKMLKALGVEGTSVFVANGGVAGQNAPHLIVHIIPRKKDDSIRLNPSLKEFSVKELQSKTEKMLKHLGLSFPVPVIKEKKEDEEEIKDEKREVKIVDNNVKESVKEENVEIKKVSSSKAVDLDEIAKLFE